MELHEKHKYSMMMNEILREVVGKERNLCLPSVTIQNNWVELKEDE